MKFIVAHDANEIQQIYNDALTSGIDVCSIVSITKPIMLSGLTPFYVKQECDGLDVDVVTVEHSYGSIIIFPRDFTSFCITTKPNNYGKDCIYSIKSMLKNLNIDVQVEGNDLMVEGYKVGSWAARRHLDCTVSGVQFSINTDAELIKKLCKKPMKKYPGALKDYGITANDILNHLKQTGIISKSFPTGEEIWQTSAS